MMLPAVSVPIPAAARLAARQTGRIYFSANNKCVPVSPPSPCRGYSQRGSHEENSAFTGLWDYACGTAWKGK